MSLDLPQEASMRPSGLLTAQALVTGASGFVGRHVVEELLSRGIEIRALVRRGSETALGDLPIQIVIGDVTDRASVERAVQGTNVLFHVAADYRFWVPDPETMQRVNVEGTRMVVDAALKAGVRRIVYTSSTVTVACSADRLGTESDFLPLEACRSLYQRTKILAEQEVRRFIEHGAPIVIVNPSTPIGAWDRKPTPTGRLIVDFLNGRLPAYVEALFNWIAVRDVAVGHWLAAERGRVGERYILGHDNRRLSDFLAMLSDVSSLPAPRTKIPYAVAFLAGAAGDGWGWMTGRSSRATLDGVRMAAQPMQFDSSKAVKELGLPQTPLRNAIADAVQWFRERGYAPRRAGT